MSVISQDYRTTILLAHMHNTSGFATEARSPSDYFHLFRSLHEKVDAKPREMTTEETVKYLREGFSLFIPR